MLHAIYEDGTIEWACTNEECEFAEARLSAHAEHATVKYLPVSGKRGAVIALPQCLCGTQTFLKADYTRKELLSGMFRVVDDQGQERGHILKLGHVRNLLLHHMLHLQGRAPEPLVPLPSRETLVRMLENGLPHEVALAFWWTHVLIGEQVVMLPGFDSRLLQIETRANI